MHANCSHIHSYIRIHTWIRNWCVLFSDVFYRQCLSILKNRSWTDCDEKMHFESGVCMGVGMFNLVRLAPLLLWLYRSELESFLSHLAHLSVMISDSMASHQPKLPDSWHRTLSHLVCLFTPLYTDWWQRQMLCDRLAQGRTRQCSGWNWTCDLQSQVQRPNHYATKSKCAVYLCCSVLSVNIKLTDNLLYTLGLKKRIFFI